MSEGALNTIEKVLFLDDDEHLLSGIRRALRRGSLSTVTNAQSAFQALESEGPFAVIVSDPQMPGMNGIEFLSRTREKYPDSVRILLTGQGDLSAATKAINEGNVFRFLTKPCDTQQLEATLTAGIEQYRLITAEKVLLQETLNGSLRVLTEILSLVSPLAFGRASRVASYMRELVKQLNLSSAWKFETAAMLSQIGCITIPAELLEKVFAGMKLTDVEQKIFAEHPQVGKQLVARIPRLEEIAEVIARQRTQLLASDVASSSVESVPFIAHLLMTLIDFDRLQTLGKSRREALNLLRGQKGKYLSHVLDALKQIQSLEQEEVVRELAVGELLAGMVLVQDVMTKNGMLLVSRGQEVTEIMIQRLRNYSGGGGVGEPVVARWKIVT